MGVKKKHGALSIILIKTQQLQKMGHLWQTDFKIINISIIIYITKAQQVLGISPNSQYYSFHPLPHVYFPNEQPYNSVVMVTMKRHTDRLSIFALC